MKKIIAFGSIVIAALSLAGCGSSGVGGGTSSGNPTLSIQGPKSIFFGNTYTYIATAEVNGFPTESVNISNCSIHGINNAITVVSKSFSGNTCRFQLKDTNTTSQNIASTISIDTQLNNSTHTISASQDIEVYNQAPPPPAGNEDTWQLKFPGTANFPLFVEKAGQPSSTQYITGPAYPAYIGYKGKAGEGTYRVIMPKTKDGSNYISCHVTMSATGVVAAQSTCPTPVVQTKLGNVIPIVYGAGTTNFTSATAPTIPSVYSTPATVTFINDYTVPVTIREIVNRENPTTFIIQPQNSKKVTTQNSTNTETTNFEVIKIGDVNTGLNGGPNQQVNYGTLFEATYPPFQGPKVQDDKAATYDISSVNGFNIRFKAYPSNGDWAQSSFSETNSALGSRILMYNSAFPSGEMNPSSSLETLCNNIATQMPGYDSQTFTSATNSLWVVNANQSFAGCMSPLAVTAAVYTPNEEGYKKYNCTGQYGTAGSCTFAAGSPFVTALDNRAGKVVGAYSFPFNDAVSTFSMYPNTTPVTVVLNPSQD